MACRRGVAAVKSFSTDSSAPSARAGGPSARRRAGRAACGRSGRGGGPRPHRHNKGSDGQDLIPSVAPFAETATSLLSRGT